MTDTRTTPVSDILPHPPTTARKTSAKIAELRKARPPAPREINPASAPTRPYLLESATIAHDMGAARDSAIAEIDRIDNDLLTLKLDANRQIESIQSRLDAEIAARQRRRDDLALIVAATDNALQVFATPPTTPCRCSPRRRHRPRPPSPAQQTPMRDPFVEFFIRICLGVFCIAIGFTLGYISVSNTAGMIDACRKTHDVYACRLIAVPVEPQETDHVQL